MVAADIYELVQEHFGEPASPDLVLTVREGGWETALDFGRRYQEWVTTQRPRVAEKPTRQLRPFIEAAYHGPKGVSLFAPAFSKDENPLWAVYDGLVHHLLYCHSVAIENPLMHLITSSGPGRGAMFLSLQGGMLGFRANPTVILSRYIALLTELGGLVDCGAVVIVETGPSSMSGFAPQIRVYRESDSPGTGTYQFRGSPYVLSDAQFAQIQQRVSVQLAERTEAELAWRHPEGDITDFERQDTRRTLLRIALGKVVNAARVCDRVGDLDIYLHDHFEEHALTEALAVAPEWLTVSQPPPHIRRQMMLLGRLLQLDLPDLSNLAPGDIRAIRRSDETFNRWRHALASSLGAMETLPDVPLTEEQLNTLRREIYENILEVGLAINTSIDKSDIMKAGKGGVLKLTVGLLLSGLGAAPVTAAHAGLTGLQKLGTTAFSKKQQKPIAESIDRHTVLFATSG